MKYILYLLLMIFSIQSFSKTESDSLKKVDKIFIFHEWPGPNRFSEILKSSKIDGCNYLNKSLGRLGYKKYLIKRILLTHKYYDCESKESLIKKYLKSKHVTVIFAALELAGTLDTKRKTGLKPLLNSIHKNSSDKELKRRIDGFQ